MKSQIDIFEEIIVDNFAGGGGASTGIELASGRTVAIAINDDPGTLMELQELVYEFYGIKLMEDK